MSRVLLALPLVVAMLALSAVAALGMVLASTGSASAQVPPPPGLAQPSLGGFDAQLQQLIAIGKTP
jgi:hypothetical protein